MCSRVHVAACVSPLFHRTVVLALSLLALLTVYLEGLTGRSFVTQVCAVTLENSAVLSSENFVLVVDSAVLSRVNFVLAGDPAVLSSTNLALAGDFAVLSSADLVTVGDSAVLSSENFVPVNTPVVYPQNVDMGRCYHHRKSNDPGCPDECYCEAVIIALHIASAEPSGPISAIVVCVPQEIASTVADSPLLMVPVYAPGDDVAIEEVGVGLLLADPTFLAGKLVGGISQSATLMQFHSVPGCLPSSAEVFSLMELTEPLNRGSLIHLDLDVPAVRVLSDGYESDAYRSAAEDTTEPAVMVTQLSVLGVKKRRLRGKQSGPTLLGLGASSMQLGELIQATKPKPSPRSTAKAKSTTQPPAATSGNQEILTLLHSLNERMLKLEQARRPPTPAPGHVVGSGAHGIIGGLAASSAA
eukprot:5520922-Amphidinium_carterae.1